MTATMSLREKPVQKGFSKLDYLLLFFVTTLTICLLFSWLMPGLRAEASLTEAFQTKSFRGSAEALTKANWIGMILHYVISWFSFLGLCLTLYQKFITLLYLSARNLFDNIYLVKKERMGGKALGYQELFKSLFTEGSGAKEMGGGGLDVFITFFYSLLPNVKAYSDFNPDRKSNEWGGSQVDTEKDASMGVTQYMLKTAIPTIMLVFFLTIGYSGTLAQAYGIVVDGMAAAADHLVSQNLAVAVKNMLGSTGTYSFKLSNLNTEGGNYAQKVAEEMYKKIIIECTSMPDSFKTSLGMVLEDTVFGAGEFFIPACDTPKIATPNPTNEGILGGNNAKEVNAQLTALLMQTVGEANQGKIFIGTDEAYKDLQTPDVYLSQAPTSNVGGIVWKIDDLLSRAQGGDQTVKLNKGNENDVWYIHVVTKLNLTKVKTYLVANNRFVDSDGNSKLQNQPTANQKLASMNLDVLKTIISEAQIPYTGTIANTETAKAILEDHLNGTLDLTKLQLLAKALKIDYDPTSKDVPGLVQLIKNSLY